jgi:4-amino-4-deoxy-L-arabinose transferase-like glycosyltransferase
MANSHDLKQTPTAGQRQLLDPPQWIAVLLAVIVLGNFAGLFGVGVHTDESYYWVWSRYLDWSYYDHPPLVAWMIRLSSDLFGINKFSLRFPAVLAWLATAIVVYRMALRMFANNATAAWLAVLVLVSIPIFQVGFHIVGPDSPLMLFTSLTYLFAFNAIERSSGKDWLLAGACLGLALLGKYTAILLPAIIFLAVVSGRESRAELVRWQPWTGLLLAAFLFTPVLYWNYQHDWISFAYQWGHGTDSQNGFSIYKMLDYASQQISAVMPWTWFAMMYASYRLPGLIVRGQCKSWLLVEYGFWFPLLFFWISGSFSTAMHNWPVIAYIPGSIMLGGLLSHWLQPAGNSAPGKYSSRTRAAVIAAVVFAALLVDLARFPQWAALLPNPKRLGGSSIVAVWGWGGLATAIKDVEKRHHFPRSCKILFIKDYNDASLGYFHIAGEMAYALRDPDRILLEPVRHQKQYNLWSNTNLQDMSKACMVVAGPSKKPDFPGQITRNQLGTLVLDLQHTITLPDTTSSYYAIYIRKPKSQ